jgi:phosphate/sulfate permease
MMAPPGGTPSFPATVFTLPAAALLSGSRFWLFRQVTH